MQVTKSKFHSSDVFVLAENDADGWVLVWQLDICRM